VLVEVAKLLKNNLRYSDYGCRWGGEEFLILLSHTRLEQAKVVAEKLQKLVCKMKVPPIERISASFGLSEYKINESYEETIKRADLALYKAKAEGKNCIIAL
ncbi:MAG: GGDEF domain-containing protein, partial [Thermodesulfobacteriaceae bacterium]|nr:GGDEF domain-containing protein [Thermodesulfobacteriaceae bacterium]